MVRARCWSRRGEVSSGEGVRVECAIGRGTSRAEA